MTTHPAPAPDNRIDVDTLRPEERAYVDRLSRALRCGVPGCSCASGHKFHCPAHPNPEIATLTVDRLHTGLRLLLPLHALPPQQDPRSPCEVGPRWRVGVVHLRWRAGRGARLLLPLHPPAARLALAQPHSPGRAHPHRRLPVIQARPPSPSTSPPASPVGHPHPTSLVPPSLTLPFCWPPSTATPGPPSCPSSAPSARTWTASTSLVSSLRATPPTTTLTTRRARKTSRRHGSGRRIASSTSGSTASASRLPSLNSPRLLRPRFQPPSPRSGLAPHGLGATWVGPTPSLNVVTTGSTSGGPREALHVADAPR